MKHNAPPLVMSFSALDSSGGAGLVADAQTINALKCFPLCVLTANTIQNTARVFKVQSVDSAFLKQQAQSILAESDVKVFKIGVLGSINNVLMVSQIAKENPHIPVVWDPVLKSGAGDSLNENGIVQAFKEHLLSCCLIATPNVKEAQSLGGVDFLKQHIPYLLVTGTEDKTKAVIHHFYHQQTCKKWVFPRLKNSFHGSGCTLSSAIACNLAHQMPILNAIDSALAYTFSTLKNAFQTGKNQKTPNRTKLWSMQ